MSFKRVFYIYGTVENLTSFRQRVNIKKKKYAKTVIKYFSTVYINLYDYKTYEFHYPFC